MLSHPITYGMTPATAIRSARQRAGLSKRALARRAGTSPAAVVLYESGARQPTLPTLERILAATGQRAELTLAPVRDAPDRLRAGLILAEVLELAEHLPLRPPDPRLAYPRLASPGL
jgi:transcriptional regulator with XRE-family HTH domain